MDNPSEQAGGYASHDAGAYRIQTSRPECLYRHDISDEELVMLTNSSSDGFKDAMWASVGSTISALPSAAYYGYEYAMDTNHHLGALGFISISVFLMSVAVGACMFFVCKDKKTSSRILSDAIRARSPKTFEKPKSDALKPPFISHV